MPTDVQIRMETYRQQVDHYVNGFIGRIYPKIAVGCLDDSLSLFASITHGLVAQGDPESSRTAYLVPVSRKDKGIRVPREKRHLVRESRAVIIGRERPDELKDELLDLKNQYKMDGVLYMTVLPSGQIDDAKYFNHITDNANAQERPATPELPAKASRQIKAKSARHEAGEPVAANDS